jgi:hypothetical protein
MLAFWPCDPDATEIRCDLHWHLVRLQDDADAGKRVAFHVQEIAMKHGATVLFGSIEAL